MPLCPLNVCLAQPLKQQLRIAESRLQHIAPISSLKRRPQISPDQSILLLDQVVTQTRFFFAETMKKEMAGRSSSASTMRERKARNYANTRLSVLGRLLTRPACEHAPKPSENSKPSETPRFGALLAACESSTGRLTVAQLREFEPSGDYCLYFCSLM